MKRTAEVDGAKVFTNSVEVGILVRIRETQRDCDLAPCTLSDRGVNLNNHVAPVVDGGRNRDAVDMRLSRNGQSRESCKSRESHFVGFLFFVIREI